MVILHRNDMKHAFNEDIYHQPININQTLLLLKYLKTSVNFNCLFYLLPNPWKYRMICAFYQIYFFCGTNQQYIKHIHTLKESQSFASMRLIICVQKHKRKPVLLLQLLKMHVFNIYFV